MGASKVVHPVMAEACVDFAARAIKELFPPDGPVKTKIIGEVTEQKVEVAERKRDYMNWQLTEQIEEYRDEQEQMLTQLPLGGSQFLKLGMMSRKSAHALNSYRLTTSIYPLHQVISIRLLVLQKFKILPKKNLNSALNQSSTRM